MLDANTFRDNNIIQFLNHNFINLKINAETEYGQQLFDNYSGNAYPMILFLDNNKNEIDRFYGYYDSEEFLLKLNNILKGVNTFPNLLKQYESGNNSPEIIFHLASKYADRGEDSLAVILYTNVITSNNVSIEMFLESKYFIASNLLWKDGDITLKTYINAGTLRLQWVRLWALKKEKTLRNFLRLFLSGDISKNKAIKKLKQKIKLNPNPTLKYLLARQYHRAKKFSEAIKLLQSPHPFAPINVERIRLLADSNFHLQNFSQATIHFKHYLEVALTSGEKRRAQDWIERTDWMRVQNKNKDNKKIKH